MKKFLWTIIIVLMTGGSCTDLTEVEGRLDVLEQEVSDIQDAIEALQVAYQNGKVIKSVEPSQNSNGGWIIT
ncbi:MAG: hypothetical protein IJ952_08560, partial [Alistipes sp.]|nr:hypothetical protein [Alistipes sp.]